MDEKTLPCGRLAAFREYLINAEKSAATVEKYLRDVRAFCAYIGALPVTKEAVVKYKCRLVAHGYAARSVNSMLTGINCFLSFLGLPECRVKSVRLQRQIYCAESRELTKAEYMRLLDAAKRRPRLRLVMETICGTGIRVSELKCFTVEAVRRGEVTVSCKGKRRKVLLPGKLRRMLLSYAAEQGIRTGESS